MEREGLEYLVNEGFEKNVLVETPVGLYSKVSLNKIKPNYADALHISTLTGLVDYIKENIDKLNDELLIQVNSPTKVTLLSSLDIDKNRETYIITEPELPAQINWSRFYDSETFNIALQSRFVITPDKGIVLEYMSRLTQDNSVSLADDGVTQVAQIKTGVTTVSKAKVPNPVNLAPYRTFTEIEQPISAFVFRVNKEGEAALFEADGGAWKNAAILSIKDWLKTNLKDIDKVKIIA